MRPRKTKNGEKKVPQRGLGVAQLEKLRMEEQQKECLSLGLDRNSHHVLKTLFQQQHNHPHHHYHHSRSHSQATAVSGSGSGSSSSSSSFFIPTIGGLPAVGSVARTSSPSCAEPSSSLTAHDCVVVGPPERFEGLPLPFSTKTSASPSPSELLHHSSFSHHQHLPPSNWFAAAGHPPEFSMTNIASCGMMQMEPPSNQNNSCNSSWQEEDTMPKRKRFSLFSQEDTIQPKLSRLELFDTDASAILRSIPLSSPLSIQRKGQWQTSLTMTSGSSMNLSDIVSFDSGYAATLRASSLGHGPAKDCCSSTGSMQPVFQLNWRASNENDISSQEKEPCGDFLSLGLFPSFSGQSSTKLRQQPAISDGKHSTSSDGHGNGLLIPLHQDVGSETGSPVVYQFEGLLKHSSSSRVEKDCSAPLYKFICHEPNDKDITSCVYHSSNKLTHADLDLTLSL